MLSSLILRRGSAAKLAVEAPAATAVGAARIFASVCGELLLLLLSLWLLFSSRDRRDARCCLSFFFGGTSPYISRFRFSKRRCWCDLYRDLPHTTAAMTREAMLQGCAVFIYFFFGDRERYRPVFSTEELRVASRRLVDILK